VIKGGVKFMVGTKIKCDCGKFIAVERDGKIYIKCKGCKREVEISMRSKNKKS